MFVGIYVVHAHLQLEVTNLHLVPFWAIEIPFVDLFDVNAEMQLDQPGASDGITN